MRVRPLALVCVFSLASLAQSSLPRDQHPSAKRAPSPSATDAQTLLTLMQILFSDPLVQARRFWTAELREGMTLAEFEAKFPKGSEGYQHFISLIVFWETVGSLMRKGLVNEDLAFDTFLDAPPWKRVATILKEKRERDKQPLEAVNFEWIAGRAAQWIARHEHDAQPK
jgi:hypothetical protein